MSKKSYPVRLPRAAAGIRAQFSRGEAARNWWAKRWLSSLEAMGLGPRLGRARNYALSGQVISLAKEGGRVSALVQGSRPEPYRITLDFRAPDAAAHARIAAAIRAEPMLAARLLADDLPTEVVEIFRREGFDLFPGGKLGPGRYDVTVSCSCPDYANPCKHSAAVLILLGEEVAWHPMSLLAFRGIGEEELYEG